MRFINRIFSIGLFILFLVGCTTQKNTLITRTYHNTTARFNILFNGRESYKEAIEKINENYEEDYTSILPIYLIPEEASMVAGELNRTISKGSKNATMHSITVKPERKGGFVTLKEQEFYNKKEFNKWMDENYLLIGKAHFYKLDFKLAEETFRFILSQYPNTSVKHETYIWLARAFLEQNDFLEAEEILVRLNNDYELPKNLRTEFYSTYANLYLKQQKYGQTIEWLEKALEVANKKQRKIRYTYILAQLNLELGNTAEASQYFAQVIKMNPPYEMTFNARISLALAFDKDVNSSSEIEDLLRKMLKDEKNIEFKDQIYYALANIELNKGNKEEGIRLLQESANHSIDNAAQLAETYLQLANLYYAEPDYLEAQAYYDSAVMNLDEEYPDLDAIYLKANSLGRLVRNIRRVELNDSLMLLASLPEQERIQRIDNIIAKVKRQEDEARKKEQEMRQQQAYAQNQSALNRTGGTSAEGKWYFYNLAAKSVGQPEFKLRWGNRKLEDNWRRKNKTQMSMDDMALEDSQELMQNQNIQTTADKKSREYYLQALPLSDSAQQVSQSQVQASLFNIGMIYRNELKDQDKAKEAFTDLTTRFPDGDLSVVAYYALYEMNKQNNNQTLANTYRDIILSKYPESIYSRILTEPDYLTVFEDEEQKLTTYYQQTYEQFNDNRYAEVLDRIQNAPHEIENTELEANFAYLAAVSRGRLANDSVLREEMVAFINNYPNTPPVEFANSLVTYLDRAQPELLEAKEEEIAKQIYDVAPEAPHYVVAVVNGQPEMNQLVFNLINFNLDNFDNLNLTTNGQDFTGNQKLINVEPFKNKKEATVYYTKMYQADQVFNDLNKDGIRFFIISEQNFERLLEDKSISRYLKFYQEYYSPL